MSLPDAFVEVEYWDAQHELGIYLKIPRRGATPPLFIELWMAEQQEFWRFFHRG